ncbi:S24 family peptidase [Ectothiorhodospira haloalkaliphila]|uniref:S24 family peptidase n=1 Tax=Ectothiorhodospira haloalkaliphila TaxID=421628 RepID=UPI003B75C995
MAQWGLCEQDALCVEVEGDGMHPTLCDGDIMLVDRGNAWPPEDGVYLICLEGVVLLKRLQNLPGQKLRLTSDHPAYEPFEMNRQDFQCTDQTRILGRVIWSGHGL